MVTRKKTLRGKGFTQSVFGTRPTRSEDPDVYFKTLKGIIVSNSKTTRSFIYSKDGGKTWSYIFKNEDGGILDYLQKNRADKVSIEDLKYTPIDQDGFDAFKSWFLTNQKKYKARMDKIEAERIEKKQYEPEDGDIWRDMYVKNKGLPANTPYFTALAKYAKENPIEISYSRYRDLINKYNSEHPELKNGGKTIKLRRRRRARV